MVLPPSPTTAHEHVAGHRQPGDTCAQEATRPGSQGTTTVQGTWCSEGDAGRHLRTSSPRRGQGLRARCPCRCDWNGSPLRHALIPTWRSPRSLTIWMWRCWKTHSDASTRAAPRAWTGSRGARTRRTWQPTWRPYTEKLVNDTYCPQPVVRRLIPKSQGKLDARAPGPGGQDCGESRGEAAGGDLRAGLLRRLLWLSPWPQPTSGPSMTYARDCLATGLGR